MSEFALNRRIALLCGLGVATIALSYAAPPLFQTYGDRAFVPCLMASGAVAYVASRIVRGAPRGSALLIVLLVAAIVRVIAISCEPLTSTDVYRYVWDGRVQLSGVNPYRYVPADPALAGLRDAAIYPNINRADYARTIYPPFAQYFFLLTTALGGSLLSLRLGLLGCEALIVGCLMALLRKCGRPPASVVAYAWHPLVIWEVANGGHVDGLVALLLVASLLALVSAKRLTGAALVACAVLVKPYVAVVLPAFWRPWDWRAPALVVALVALMYLPYIGVGAAVFGFLPGYVQEEGLNTGGAFWLVAVVHYFAGDIPGLSFTYFALALGTLAYLALKVAREPSVYEPARQYGDAMAFLAVAIFFLSPNYPWYYLPLVPLAVIVGGAPTWIMTIGALLLHVAWPDPSHPEIRFLIWKSVMNIALILSLLLSRGRRAGEASRSSTTSAFEEAGASPLDEPAKILAARAGSK